jgi:acetylornithine deacetylase
MDLIRFTKKLLSIPSPSGQEKELEDFLYAFFQYHKMPVEKQKISEKRYNLWIFPAAKQSIMLCTHMDTVSPFIPPSEDHDYIYGRGACDAKGIMATMIQAARELTAEGYSGFGLLFVVGEETDSIGAKAAAASGRHSLYIIVGEPTQNCMGKSHLGYLALKLKAKGKAAHSAFPDLGNSAIDQILDGINHLRLLKMIQADGKNGNLMNVAQIKGGTAPNIIAEHAESIITFRTRISTNQLLEKIHAALPQTLDIKVLNRAEPQTLFTLPSFKQIVLPYGTDIPYLKPFGQPILFGPGSGEDAHTSQEKISKKELLDAVSHYKTIVKYLLSKEEG